MSELTTKQRNRLKSSSFVYPSERRYPIHDRAHAINALARVKTNGTPAEKRKVYRTVCKKYPGLAACQVGFKKWVNK